MTPWSRGRTTPRSRAGPTDGGRIPRAAISTMSRGDPLDRSLLTVVVPVFNEEENLAELAMRLPAAADPTGFRDLEFLMVSDGSTDRTEAMIRGLAGRDPRFRG